ncbi:MAG TPA: DUF4403 family protein [Nitrospirota bacterium]|nr:DUF4403 family protein [Nitrospirota bacterium]
MFYTRNMMSRLSCSARPAAGGNAAVACVLLVLAMAGCAHFVVPAPHDPVVPLVPPHIEDSLIVLPLRVQTNIPGVDSLLEDPHGALGARIRKFLSRQASKFDDQLLRSESVQHIAGLAWETLQSPVRIADDTYLLLDLQAMRLSIPPLGREGAENVHAILELTARPKILAGVAPETISRSTPSLSLAAAPGTTGFRVVVESETSFSKISAALTEQQKGKIYRLGNSVVQIAGVRLYPSGKDVVLEVHVTGDKEGTVYLSGVPDYDIASQTLYLRNLDYTVDTRNVLDRAAEWMLHTEIRGKMEEQARWPLGERMEDAARHLNKALNRELTSHLYLTGTISRIQPVAVGVTAHSIKAVFTLEGAAELTTQ